MDPYANDDFDCRLCVEINDFEHSLFAKTYPGVLKRNIFFETTHLQVMIPVGPLWEGHLLIATKRHASSYGHVEQNILSDLVLLVDEVSTLLEPYYGRIVIFEHGPVSKIRRGGCCLDHAHVNLIPIPESYSMFEAVSDFMPLTQVEFSQLGEFIERDEPYLFFRCPREGSFAAVATEGSNQFFRKLLAYNISGGAWDWRGNPQADLVSAMVEKLSGLTGTYCLDRIAPNL